MGWQVKWEVWELIDWESKGLKRKCGKGYYESECEQGWGSREKEVRSEKEEVGEGTRSMEKQRLGRSMVREVRGEESAELGEVGETMVGK